MGTSRVKPTTARDAGTEIAGGAARARLVKRFRLQVVEGPDTGKQFVSGGERAVVGTHESADLVLDDRSVSRFHCEIALAEQQVTVRDLGSKNGTLVDEVPVLQAYLLDGACLTLGHTVIRFSEGEERVRVPTSNRSRFGLMVGESPALRATFATLERAAKSDATILLGGETGTGKEVAAESIHLESPRKQEPFVIVDCGAMPPDLLESELFGHEKGAFTGAVAAREGAFEAADRGTIFLDEIGELGTELQPKLLRVLERRHIKRVGGSRYLPVDVRVIAATNRELRAEVNAGRFRSDLFFRLAVVEVRLPPLRERPEDLPLLVKHILDAAGASDRREAAALLKPRFLEGLARHAWPGNVRELRNYVERCLALEETPSPAARLSADAAGAAAAPGAPVITGADDFDLARPLKPAREAWTREFERRYLVQAMARHAGNVTAAARAAGVDRMYFYRLLWRHGLK